MLTRIAHHVQECLNFGQNFIRFSWAEAWGILGRIHLTGHQEFAEIRAGFDACFPTPDLLLCAHATLFLQPKPATSHPTSSALAVSHGAVKPAIVAGSADELTMDLLCGAFADPSLSWLGLVLCESFTGEIKLFDGNRLAKSKKKKGIIKSLLWVCCDGLWKFGLTWNGDYSESFFLRHLHSFTVPSMPNKGRPLSG